MAGFWRPRRQAEIAQPDDADGVNVATGAELHDPELEAQLAHLEAIERRHEQLLTEGGFEGATELRLPEEAWPAAIPAVPAADGVEPLLQWMELARAVLSARASRNRDELQRLSSQWVHISRNLGRFRADEVAAVVEAEARVRERIAGDETAVHLVRLLNGYLGTWSDSPAESADVALMRSVVESLSALALDVEVVHRQAERDPAGAAEALRGLQQRLANMVEDLRTPPGANPPPA